MNKMKMTIEKLAEMTQRGFESLEKTMEKRFDEVDKRFDRIENITLRNHKNRIEKLEDNVREIKTTLKK